MTDIATLLHSDRVRAQASITSKKKALEVVSQLLAPESAEMSEHTIFEALIKRERLGSTGLGAGIALPHGRIAGLEAPLAAMLTLDQGIDFDAIDNAAVDIIFAVVVPENCTEQHLQILGKLAETFSQAEVCAAIRRATSASELIALVTQ
ncbi:MAG: PTS IIA-like nitrogen regulatory protein PtsN [Pseudomonadota bacterium]